MPLRSRRPGGNGAAQAPALRGGIDLGGTKIQAVVIKGDDEVVGQSRHPTPTTGGPGDVVTALATAVTEAAQAAGIKTSALAGIGLGSPGEIDDAAGTISRASNLPGMVDPHPVGPELHQALGAPVRIGNDVSVATLAEFELGAGRPYRSILGVFWGTGVGGGLILDGKPWHGRGGAGEIGHVVVKRNGAFCPCGRRGCMEAYAGRKAIEAEALARVDKGARTKLFKIMEKKGRERITSGVIADAVDEGDELAIWLVERAIKALGTGVASAINLLDVEAIVLGGGLGVRFGQDAADRIATAMLPHLFNDDTPPAMHVATLGDFGGAIGAARLVGTAPAPKTTSGSPSPSVTSSTI
jgi:glucokinase